MAAGFRCLREGGGSRLHERVPEGPRVPSREKDPEGGLSGRYELSQGARGMDTELVTLIVANLKASFSFVKGGHMRRLF